MSHRLMKDIINQRETDKQDNDSRSILDKVSDNIKNSKVINTLSAGHSAKEVLSSVLQRPNDISGVFSEAKHFSKLPETVRNNWRFGIPNVSEIVQLLPGSAHIHHGLTFKLPDKISKGLDSTIQTSRKYLGSKDNYTKLGQGVKYLGAAAQVASMANLGANLYDLILRKKKEEYQG